MDPPFRDPWAVSDQEDDTMADCADCDLNIMDVSEDETSNLVSYPTSGPGWITQAKQQAFLHGCRHTDHLAKAQAFRAVHTPTVVQSFLGLDSGLGPCQIADVRSQPLDQDPGYPAAERHGRGPKTSAIVASLLRRKELIESCNMVYLIVDNRAPEEVAHWPAFAQWWSSRRALIGPQQERTDVVWIQASYSTGLRDVPYYWAGVFVLEVARFLFPTVHLGLAVTLFEVNDLVALARNQFVWADLVGHHYSPDQEDSKIGMLLFTEAHLEYNAGLVISLGSTSRPSPVTTSSTPFSLAAELEDYRQQLLAMATPPECPTDASQGGSLFTPLVGVPMETSLDLAVVWALYGTYMCRQFWPIPLGKQADGHEQTPEAVTWPRRAHPGALSAAGQERTPWLASWARATFEQGCLSVLPHMEGSCKAISLPGEHLFQASRIRSDRMRPVIFHPFGKAKVDAPAQLSQLARQGWETLPIALLGMPHHPAAWSTDDWKPIGGCCFTGAPSALRGNSAFRFCLLCQWHAFAAPSTELFQDTYAEGDSDLEPTHVLSETNEELLTRTLLAAAASPNSRESGSRLEQGSSMMEQSSRVPRDPQLATPPLFVSWHYSTATEHSAGARSPLRRPAIDVSQGYRYPPH